jgi:kynurenine formamidase
MKETTKRRGFLKAAGLIATGAAFAEALASREAKATGGHGSDRDDFIRSVKRARIFDLSHVWDENSPIAGVNPPYAMELAATHANTLGTFGDGGKLSFTSEIMQWSGQHGAPSIDAIGHIGRNGKLFGGVDAVKATSDTRGLGRSGVGAHLDIAHYPKEMLVNRAVLLDVARFINRNKREALAAGFDITGDMLHDTARHQGVRIERGDTVLIRTGWGKYFKTNPDFYKGDAAAGVGVSGARFLVREKARVVGNDTLTFEVRPPIAGTPGGPDFEVFPVHMLLIPDNGINIIENYFLEEIAAAEEYEFILVVPPIKIRGGTGSALRSFALVP